MIDPATLRAYRETEYRVEAPYPLVLRIGLADPDLLALYRAAGVDCAALVTACNPRSRRLPQAQNARREAALRAGLLRDGWRFLPASGAHPAGGWPAEPGVFVPGLGRDAACALGRAWAQAAIVWCGADAVPQLVLLDGPDAAGPGGAE